MGLPALQRETDTYDRPRLSIVPDDGARGRRRSTVSAKVPRRTARAHAHAGFRVFVMVAVLFAGLGMVRVALASRAAAVSIESGTMREQIKQARFEGDSLEIRVSQLATPSRIRSAANSRMKMAPPGGISYVTIDSAAKEHAPAKPSTAATEPVKTSDARVRTGSTLLSSVMYAAAGEAQILLLGDVGLASAR